jgi:hypothetical protein
MIHVHCFFWSQARDTRASTLSWFRCRHRDFYNSGVIAKLFIACQWQKQPEGSLSYKLFIDVEVTYMLGPEKPCAEKLPANRNNCDAKY